MARWTASYPLPLASVLTEDYDKRTAHSVVVGNDIWIFHNVYNSESLHFYIWSTETHEYTEKHIPYPEDYRRIITSVSLHENHIYIWATDDFIENEGVLHKLNTNTMKLEEIMRVYMQTSMYSTCIVGDYLYALDKERITGVPIVYIINLSEARVKGKHIMPRFTDSTLQLMKNDDKGYLVVTSERTKKRKVYLINGEKIRRVAEDEYGDKNEAVSPEGCCVGGKMFHSNTREWGETILSLDSFDFSKNEWTRARIETVGKCPRWDVIQSFVELNDCIYAITKRHGESHVKMTLRVMKKNPRLTTICLLNAAREMVRQGIDVEDVTEDLPIELGSELEKMYNWKGEDFGLRKWLDDYIFD